MCKVKGGELGGWRMHLRKCVHNMQHKWKCRLENILFLGLHQPFARTPSENALIFLTRPMRLPKREGAKWVGGLDGLGGLGGGWLDSEAPVRCSSGVHFRNWTAFFVELCADCNSFHVCVGVFGQCTQSASSSLCHHPATLPPYPPYPLSRHTHTDTRRGKIWKFWLHVSIQNGAAKTNSNWWWGMPILTRTRDPFYPDKDWPVVKGGGRPGRGSVHSILVWPNCSAFGVVLKPRTLDFCAFGCAGCKCAF